MQIPDAPAMGEMAESAPTIPEASYNFRVHKAEYVAVPKSATAKGPYIKLQLVVTGPSSSERFIGRMVFENYSVTGEGTWRLRDLLSVTGHDENFKLEDSDQLLNLEFGGAVAIEKGTGGYGDRNRIKKHLALLPDSEMAATIG